MRPPWARAMPATSRSPNPWPPCPPRRSPSNRPALICSSTAGPMPTPSSCTVKTHASGRRSTVTRTVQPPQFQRILLGQPGVEQVGQHLPGQLGRVQVPPLQRLHRVFQLGRQVQVADEPAQPLALGPDHAGLFPGRGGQRRVGFQRAGVAQHHGQRGAHIVGDAVDPLGPGGVPPGHLGRHPVQRRLHRPQLPGLGQVGGPAGRQPPHPLQQRRGAFFHPAQAAPEQRHHQQQVGAENGQAAVERGPQFPVGHHRAEPHPQHPVLVAGHHQQAAVRQCPHHHRVVLQVPAAHPGNVGGGVGVVGRRRQRMAPGDGPVRRQHHRPGQVVLGQHRLHLLLLHLAAAVPGLYQGGQLLHRHPEGGDLVQQRPQAQHHGQVGHKKQQDQPDAGEEVPAEKAAGGHRRASSTSSL